MKRTSLFILIGMVVSFGMIFINSCNQDDLAKPQDPGQTLAPRANAQPTITFVPNPGIVNQNVTVNLEFGTCGSGQLQQETPPFSGIWVQVVGSTNASAANPDITYNFVPTIVGTCTYRFRAVVTGGPGCTLYTGAQPGVCLDVISPCNIQVGDYTTYSQGYFLSSPAGLTFMNANWSDIGPVVSGGCGSNAFSLSSAQAVHDLSVGNPAGFGFRNQLITLIINSRINEDFGCLHVVGGTYTGMTVDQIIALANTVGTGVGCVAEPEGLGALLEALNQNFHEGTINNGLLTCCSQ